MKKNVWKDYYNATQIIKTGDIITRTGNDFTSLALRKFAKKDDTYSHIGIASVENDSIFIYHAIGGETNPDAHLRRDPLYIFIHPNNNQGFGIFRFNLDSMQKKQLILFAKKKFSEKLPFDMDFDLNTDASMYCAEFVGKALESIYQNPQLFAKDTIGKIIYWAPDNIFLSPNCREIKRYRYF